MAFSIPAVMFIAPVFFDTTGIYTVHVCQNRNSTTYNSYCITGRLNCTVYFQLQQRSNVRNMSIVHVLNSNKLVSNPHDKVTLYVRLYWETAWIGHLHPTTLVKCLPPYSISGIQSAEAIPAAAPRPHSFSQHFYSTVLSFVTSTRSACCGNPTLPELATVAS